ncbi:hypothetical protein AAFF_G00225930 [Aldrovandia affinis]|uniref:Uncharacterized protein n=1 Tax=Aldrovandia affinis TaxID=143900 RepID=A0AAD7X2C7_9TELE|nr:hypothetical protein AAFF_G00225930 [Aldrovandia affinis]
MSSASVNVYPRPGYAVFFINHNNTRTRPCAARSPESLAGPPRGTRFSVSHPRRGGRRACYGDSSLLFTVSLTAPARRVIEGDPLMLPGSAPLSHFPEKVIWLYRHWRVSRCKARAIATDRK